MKSQPKIRLVEFDCEAADLPPETKAEPRPEGRERRALAGELQAEGVKNTVPAAPEAIPLDRNSVTS